MFGWINDCTECLVLSKFGLDAWHQIKEKASCDVPDGGFLWYKYYPDSDTVQLVVAASEVLGLSVDDVLHAFGDYFIEYVQDNGYSNVLECLGSNMRDWLSNLNSLHDHLQASYPKGFVAPVFWSEDDTTSTEGAILVHYFSHRGSLLVPLVVGLINKLARVYFDIAVNLEQLQIQDEAEGIKHTTWRVTTVNPEEAYKLRGKRKGQKRVNVMGADGPGDGRSLLEDDTVSTATTTVTRYERAFMEGGGQAAFLRVEEFVKRSFHNPQCELFHALTMEQYVYLCDFWKENKIDNDLWCYQKWAIQDDDGGVWATLNDLPPQLNPSMINEMHFGGKVPATGAFPPNADGTLQSYPPKVKVVNDITGNSVSLILRSDGFLTLEDAIYNNPLLDEANVRQFPQEWEERLLGNELEIQLVVWNEEVDDVYHNFSLEDLKTTSTKQLYELIPKSFDPVTILLQCEEAVQVKEDEEDL